jgi:hypothetical protein
MKWPPFGADLLQLEVSDWDHGICPGAENGREYGLQGTPESYLASPGADAFRKLKRRTLDSNRGVYLYVYATSKANKMKRMSKVNGTFL